MSVSVRVPDSVREEFVSASAALSLSPVPTDIFGASFVPVMVIVSVSVTAAPCSSVTTTSNVSVTVWPTRSACTFGSVLFRSYL